MQMASSSIASAALCAAAIGAPLLAGSSAPAAISIWCIVLAIGLAAADPAALRGSQRQWLWLPAIVLASYAAVLVAQLLPPEQTGLPPYPVWERASALLGTPLKASVAIVRHEPLLAIGSPLVALMAAILGFITGADRQRAKAVFDAIAWSGAAIAVLAIASYLINPAKLFWWDKTAYREALTTPFVNRNTAALYYGMVAVAGALRFWQFLQPQLPAGRLTLTGVFDTSSRLASFRALTVATAPLLCLWAVLLTSSRAGTVLALAGQVLAFTLFFWRDLPRRFGPASALVLGGFVALVLLQTFGGSASNRFNENGLVDAERIATYRATLHMIADHPWLGVGLGGFKFAFPAYRSGSLWGVWDHAHDVPLELAAEGGVPLALIVALAWVSVLLLLVQGIRNRRRDTVFPVAAFSIAVMALAHAIIDFSLEITGFAIPAMALIGVGAAQSFTTRKQSGAHSRSLLRNQTVAQDEPIATKPN